MLLVYIMDVCSSLRNASEGLSFRKRVAQLNMCVIIKYWALNQVRINRIRPKYLCVKKIKNNGDTCNIIKK